MGVKLCFLRANTKRISHGWVFWELPRPHSGITDGGSVEMLDNHPPREKKKKKKRCNDVIGTEGKGKNKMCPLAAYRQ